MKIKQLVIIFTIALSCLTHAQKGKAVLILKDSSKINGFGEISGIASVVSVKFSNDTLKYRKYRSKEIIGINILENNYYRKFRYKYKDGGKFPEILEIVSIDSLSLYVRIYDGGTLSRPISNYRGTDLENNGLHKIQLDNGQEITIKQNQNAYSLIDFPRYSYYVGFGNSDQVEHLYTKGLPFAKGFKKSIKNYFKNCPELVEKVEQKEFLNDELWRVLDFYNRKCLKSNLE